MSNAAAGWYDDGSGRKRYWDGSQWTIYAPDQTPPPASKQTSGRTANGMNVSYVRQQKGHSLTLWIVLTCILGIPIIWLIYYSVSPNHFWHA